MPASTAAGFRASGRGLSGMLRRDAERSDRLEVDVVTFTATSH